MIYLCVAQVILTCLGGMGLHSMGLWQQSQSFAAGSALIFINLALLWLAWKLIFSKKLIALAALIIVSKYAIFGFFIYKLLQKDWFNTIFFVLGISSIAISALIYVGVILGQRRFRE